MLKNIPEILYPELLKVLAEMGHNDRLILADANFPSAAMAKNNILIRYDGIGVVELLEAILQFFPLDQYVEHPANLIEVDPGIEVDTPIWNTFEEVVAKYDSRGASAIGKMNRFDFYDMAKQAYVVIATGEKALYSCISLQKGVL